jgi:glycosyltransferase involved in cell wall biosynthesis
VTRRPQTRSARNRADQRVRITFIGPATIHLATWTKAFQEAGVDVSVITCHRAVDFAADVPMVELKSRLPRRLHLLSQARALRRSIKARQPDLVVAYYASSYGLLASLVSDCPYVVVTAGSDVNIAAGRRPYLAPLVYRALSCAAGVVCCSDSLRDAVLRFRIPADKVMVLPRGISLHRFLAEPTRHASGPVRIVCLRRFRRIFHHDTLIDACRLLRDRGVDFELTLCGDGTERRVIEAQILSVGLSDRVTIFGHLRHEEVPDIFRNADAYIALPEIDGASASLFEAMSASLCPIVSDIPANRQWIRDGVNGALVSYEDPVAVAAAIERAAPDPALRRDGVDAISNSRERALTSGLTLKSSLHSSAMSSTLYESPPTDPREALPSRRARSSENERSLADATPFTPKVSSQGLPLLSRWRRHGSEAIYPRGRRQPVPDGTGCREDDHLFTFCHPGRQSDEPVHAERAM